MASSPVVQMMAYLMNGYSITDLLMWYSGLYNKFINKIPMQDVLKVKWKSVVLILYIKTFI